MLILRKLTKFPMVWIGMGFYGYSLDCIFHLEGLGCLMNKSTRLAIFYERLRDAPSASTHDEAYELLCRLLNAVEDEYSGVPNDPANWQTDGRLYPPRKDRVYAVSGFPGVLRDNSFKHDTFIAAHGAIEVKLIATGVVHFEKPGANGKGGWG